MSTTETITVRLPKPTRDALAVEAERRGGSIADVVRDAVSRHLNETRDAQVLAGLEERLLARIETCETHVCAQIDKLVAE